MGFDFSPSILKALFVVYHFIEVSATSGAFFPLHKVFSISAAFSAACRENECVNMGRGSGKRVRQLADSLAEESRAKRAYNREVVKMKLPCDLGQRVGSLDGIMLLHSKLINIPMVDEIWQKKKVCIIDDDNDIREIYMMKFNMEGYDVSAAANGEEGLKIIREKKPDVILLDLQMPVKTGAEVLEELYADPLLSKIPVIVLTNLDNEDTFKEIGKFHTRFYLIKSLTTPQKAVDYVKEVL